MKNKVMVVGQEEVALHQGVETKKRDRGAYEIFHMYSCDSFSGGGGPKEDMKQKWERD